MKLKDKIKIIARGMFSYEHIKALSLLYKPIIGDSAFSIYLSFYSLVDMQKGESITFDISFLTNILNTTILKFDESLSRLEALLLVQRYIKSEKGLDEYIIRLNTPVLARGFKENDLLLTHLATSVGEKNIDLLFDSFHLKYTNLDDYKDISKSFTDMFKYIVPKDIYLKNNLRGLGSSSIPKIDNSFDFDKFYDLIPENLKKRNSQFLDKVYQENLINIAFIYSFDEEEMARVYEIATNNYQSLAPTKIALSSSAKNYFISKNNKSLDSFIESKDDNNLIDPINLEKISPVMLVSVLSKDKKLARNELSLIEAFKLENKEINNAVINAVIFYVYKHKGFIPNTLYLKKVLNTIVEKYSVITPDDAANFLKDIENEINLKEKNKNISYKNNENIKEVRKKFRMEWLDEVDEFLKKVSKTEE